MHRSVRLVALSTALLAPSLAAAATRCNTPVDSVQCLGFYATLAAFYAVLPAFAGAVLALLLGFAARRPLLRVLAGVVALPLVAEIGALVAIVLVETLTEPGRTTEESREAFRLHSAIALGAAALAVTIGLAWFWRWSRPAESAPQSSPL